eukprot:40734_1
MNHSFSPINQKLEIKKSIFWVMVVMSIVRIMWGINTFSTSWRTHPLTSIQTNNNKSGMDPNSSRYLPKTFWIFWEPCTSLETPPDIVKMALLSIKFYHPNWQLNVVSLENYNKWISDDYLPKHFDSLIIQHKSDVIRNILMYLYGGIYCDATVIAFGPFGEMISNILSNDEYNIEYFAFRDMPFNEQWTNWLLASIPKSTISEIYYNNTINFVNSQYSNRNKIPYFGIVDLTKQIYKDFYMNNISITKQFLSIPLVSCCFKYVRYNQSIFWTTHTKKYCKPWIYEQGKHGQWSPFCFDEFEYLIKLSQTGGWLKRKSIQQLLNPKIGIFYNITQLHNHTFINRLPDLVEHFKC